MGRIAAWLGRRQRRLPRHRLADRARPVRAGHRRLVGRRPRRQPGEVGLAARGAHRLHLRGHRRGARPDRHAAGARPVRRCSRSACSGSSLRTDDLVRPDRHRRGAGLDRRPGDDQHRRGARRCCRSSACRCRWSPTAGRRCVPTLVALGHAARRSPGGEPGRGRRRWPPAPAGCGRSLAVLPAPARRGSAAGDAVSRRSSPAAAPPATSRRCSPSPTACAAATRRPRITALGTADGLETRLVPGGRATRCELIPAVPLPRRPSPTCCGCRAGCAAARGRRRGRSTEAGADVVVGFGGYVSTPAYLAARRRGVPDRRARGERPARAWPTGSAPGSRRYVAVAVPGHAAARRAGARDAAAAGRSPRWTGPALRAEARGRTSAWTPDRPDAAGHRRLAGAQRLNVGLRRGARRTLAAAGVQVLHVAGRGQAGRAAPPAGRRGAAVPSSCRVPRPDGPRLRRRRPRACAGPGPMTVAELTAVGLPAVYVPLPDRQRRAAAQRRAGRRGRRRAAGRRRRAARRTGCGDALVPAAAPTAAGWRRWARRRPRFGDPRTPTSGSPTWSLAAAHGRQATPR